MSWIKVNNRDDLPRDGSVFLSLWKGRISLTQFDEDKDRFYIVFDPADYDHCMQIAQDRECKFEYWMKLPDYPEGW